MFKNDLNIEQPSLWERKLKSWLTAAITFRKAHTNFCIITGYLGCNLSTPARCLPTIGVSLTILSLPILISQQKLYYNSYVTVTLCDASICISCSHTCILQSLSITQTILYITRESKQGIFCSKGLVSNKEDKNKMLSWTYLFLASGDRAYKNKTQVIRRNSAHVCLLECVVRNCVTEGSRTSSLSQWIT